jgi:2-phospho-L-lactate guanylyltransferase
MTTVAVLPVKRFDDAKQRLGDALRTDVLTALRRARRIDAVVVVTSEHGANALARAHDARTIRDPDEPGHSPAASEGVRWALEQGARRAVLVPGDCPALDPTEVDDLLLAHPHSEARVTIVPDRHGTGTNALVLCPPDAIAPSFGPGSRKRHEALDDLAALRAALDVRTGGAAHTRGLLARMGRR